MITGIDSCPAGWFVFQLEKTDPGLFFDVVSSDEALLEVFRQSERVFIDIPMGISETENSRACDLALREALGREYRASVFAPPVRKALFAAGYREACDINKACTGKMISKQAWNICPKIRQVDQLLRDEFELRERVFESHPEYAFKMLNEGRALPHKKKTAEGKALRFQLLADRIPGFDVAVEGIRKQFRRKDLGMDDVFDAAALALACKASFFHGLKSLPENPPFDATGRIMAIWVPGSFS